ncbi:MAG: pilus assembly protein [Rhodocyclales bacterium]|nr:pilus assembly protein [Rhodocyclales bacterium]
MRSRRAQRGATLVIGLVMLVLLTLLGMSAFNTGTSYFRVIGNMQYQAEAASAAQAALDQVLSRGSYFTDPTTAPTSIGVDINGDGNADYTVALTQPCLLSSVSVLNAELSDAVADDRKCKGTAGGKNTGVMGQNPGGGASECARVTWRVTATVADSFTRASAQITEGTTVRMDRAVADAYKNDSTRRCAS